MEKHFIIRPKQKVDMSRKNDKIWQWQNKNLKKAILLESMDKMQLYQIQHIYQQ